MKVTEEAFLRLQVAKEANRKRKFGEIVNELLMTLPAVTIGTQVRPKVSK